MSSGGECSFATQYQARDTCIATWTSAYSLPDIRTHSRQQQRQARALHVRYLLEKPLLRSLQMQTELFPTHPGHVLLPAAATGPRSQLFSVGQGARFAWKNSCCIVLLPPAKLDQVTRACIGGGGAPKPIPQGSANQTFMIRMDQILHANF